MSGKEYGGIILPPDIQESIRLIMDDISMTRQDGRRKRSIESGKAHELCGLEPGEYDHVTVQAYLNLVDEYALKTGDALQELTRAAFRIYMRLRKDEYLMRCDAAAVKLAEESGYYKKIKNVYAQSITSFRRSARANQ
jgi:hypothetical protein